MIHEELSGKIINAFYTVYNTLGHGFLEKVYENALVIELQKRRLHAAQQKKLMCTMKVNRSVNIMQISW